jgi:hypothetical protein
VYNAAISYMGVPSSGVAQSSSICSNAYATTLKTYGFTALARSTTNELHKPGYVKGKSFCREL